MALHGQTCSAALTPEAVTVSGNYCRCGLHKRVRASGPVTVDLLNVLRGGFTKTYSRLMLAIPSPLSSGSLRKQNWLGKRQEKAHNESGRSPSGT